MTTAEVARRLRVTPSAVSRMVSRDALVPSWRGPGVRGVMLFDRAAIEAFAAERAGVKR